MGKNGLLFFRRSLRMVLGMAFFWVNVLSQSAMAGSEFWRARHQNLKETKVQEMAQLLTVQPQGFSMPPAVFSLSGLMRGSSSLKQEDEVVKLLRGLDWGAVEIDRIYLPQGWQRKDGFVLCLQDAHENVAAQKNIARLIDSVKEKTVVGVEGAQGKLDWRAYAAFSDRVFVQNFSAALLEKGLLTGTEFAAIQSDNQTSFAPLENSELYARHVESFKKSAAMQGEIQKWNEEKNRQLNFKIAELINAELNNSISYRRKYVEGKI